MCTGVVVRGEQCPEVFYRAGVARRAVPHRDAMRRVKVNRLCDLCMHALLDAVDEILVKVIKGSIIHGSLSNREKLGRWTRCSWFEPVKVV